jgi:predicted acyltransferase
VFFTVSFLLSFIDVFQRQRWSFVLRVVGMNSIAAYVIAHTINSYIANSLKIHLGQSYAKLFGDTYETLVQGSIILFLEWLILYWMYKRKIFVKI